MDPMGLEIGLYTFGSVVISPEKKREEFAGWSLSQGCCLIGKYLLKTAGQFSSYSYLCLPKPLDPCMVYLPT